MMLRRIALAFFLLVMTARASAQECYPGLDCVALAAGRSCDSPADGAPISGLAFTHNFILDSGAKLLWSRVLDALGTTKPRFADAVEGRESYPTALQKLAADAQMLSIGGQTGWRLATQQEIDRLRKLLSPPTLFHYFRAIRMATGASSVIAVYASNASPQLVSVFGFQHSNVLSDEISSVGVGGGSINDYGFWLVKSTDVETLDQLQREAAPVRETFEPIEQVKLEPIAVYQPRKRSTGVEFVQVAQGEGTVRVDGGMQTRFVAHYNLKPLPRGGFAGLEVELHARMATGSPIPLVEVRTLAHDQDDLTSAEALWDFEGGEVVGVWRFPNGARLSLTEHIARNAYYGGRDLYVWFSADSNSVTFSTPKLTAYIVKKDNLLTERPRP